MPTFLEWTYYSGRWGPCVLCPLSVCQYALSHCGGRFSNAGTLSHSSLYPSPPGHKVKKYSIKQRAYGWLNPPECQRLRGPSGHRRHVGPWELVYWDCLLMGPSHRAPPPGSAGSLCRRAFSHSSTRVKGPRPPRPERSLNPTLSPWLAVIEQW